MFRNKIDKKVIQLAMQCDVFYYKMLHLASLFNAKERQNELEFVKKVEYIKQKELAAKMQKKFAMQKSVGKPPLAWQLSEKIFRDKGDNANEVAVKHSVSIAKVYKIWQGKQPGHVAYTLATGKEPIEDATAYVEWVNVELSGN